MKMAREDYAAQVHLIFKLLPTIAKEKVFALKGGTAINLFYRDLPRLSVDIDLAYLPIADRATSLSEIDKAMDRISEIIASLPGIEAKRIRGGGGNETRVLARTGSTMVKIETSPVTRGVVFPSSSRRVTQTVETEFGFAETVVVSFEDVYGGKIHAALDRQHPRDFFDIKLLYENEGLTTNLFNAFLVYAASSSRPLHELLNPNQLDISDRYEKELVGMPKNPVGLEELYEARSHLIEDVQSCLRGNVSKFLQSLQAGEPEFSLIGLPNAADLPAVKWKVMNLRKLITANPKKHSQQTSELMALCRE
jgi:predicted nucleotidyltransferase component of viral defense system